MLDGSRFVLKLTGESGQGINSSGEILAKAIKNSGLHVFAYREYPSVIRGGVAAYQIDIADGYIASPTKQCDLLVSISRESLHEHITSVAPGGLVLHSIPEVQFESDEQDYIDANSIDVRFIKASQIALLVGGTKIMSNVVLLGIIWHYLQLDLDVLKSVVFDVFAHKPQLLDQNENCLIAGYEYASEHIQHAKISITPDPQHRESLIVSGNHAIGLGAVVSGVRNYYAYPMTPSSSILGYLSEISHETGMAVIQVEDEISAAQMALGSMHMGSRAMTGTSGGGFDLMSESLSLAGMAEIPFVCVLAQRPGPATGMPTWTAAGDLNLAINAGHGEYPKLVLAASDIESSYRLTQEAFNLAEKYQMPVVLLTEKQIAESLFNVDTIGKSIKIERGLVDTPPDSSNDRYMFTDSGISSRWLPGTYEHTYTTNSDEHTLDGSVTESAQSAVAMMDKRLRKLDSLLSDMPEPEQFGVKSPKKIVIGWGSVKNTMLDAMNLKRIPGLAYLHYEYLYPLKVDLVQRYADSGVEISIIENNATGQLGGLLKQQVTGLKLHESLLKYDGRPFFVEEVSEFITRL